MLVLPLAPLCVPASGSWGLPACLPVHHSFTVDVLNMIGLSYLLLPLWVTKSQIWIYSPS